MKSPLIWAGGKRWQVPQVAELYAPFRDRRLVEPFCGGCSIALGLAPEWALLNDNNPQLINFWRWATSSQLQLDFPLDSYFDVRAEFNKTPRSHFTQDQAQRFYALNQWAYSGLYRVNQSGGFNVPPRSLPCKPLAPLDPGLPAAAQNFEFIFGDYYNLEIDPEDFLYVDPPYDEGFTAYGKENFGWRDQIRLAAWCWYHPGPIVLMNRATERIQKLYSDIGFKLELIDSPQAMHHGQGLTSTVLEVMATKGI